ncbi:hypothetical protein [Myceligenerans pegani]|uniref:Uncharacterized protein n=1 Tax=Myceligenerans pegani TaxID=2776917 RepID=A0ABR9MT81_9MICO|nr:hypothetical protein [Myceligenerans sp. TRM 65318]MBE1874345.1 hypothetical protein [Myceligenerans sp. TRM 65318]MBE3016616.1 hypothetical protein [Myceligenerans sp. TRM 65318]
MSRTEISTGPLERTAPPDRVLLTATVLSGIAAVIGGGWLAGILPGFYTETGHALFADGAGAAAATVLHTVTALLGVAAGIAGLAGALKGRSLVVTGAVQTAVFGLVMGSMGSLSLVGYLLAFAMPVVIVVLVAQVIRKYPRLRWFVGGPALVAVVIALVLAGPAIIDALVKTAGAMAADAASIGVMLLLLATATVWAAAAVRALPSDGSGRATAWVLRHRRAITVVAATGPLPYALVRLTWLTPWPAIAPEGIDMEGRIWGLLLSSGAWLGFALTLGLILPWGEVFPRWVPGLAGRPVPIAAAAVPGGFVAATLVFTAVPMLVTFGEQGLLPLLLGAITIPCWYWGPALGLAVWGYVAHRRVQAATPAGSEAHHAAH